MADSIPSLRRQVAELQMQLREARKTNTTVVENVIREVYVTDPSLEAQIRKLQKCISQ